mmetsp:Transcript_51974/g.129381  ORF Transcript_51974/g.129381 Transcript_51974/m.129381 type:complete len:222 (-) Transcript_51974:232-897(-)
MLLDLRKVLQSPRKIEVVAPKQLLLHRQHPPVHHQGSVVVVQLVVHVRDRGPRLHRAQVLLPHLVQPDRQRLLVQRHGLVQVPHLAVHQPHVVLGGRDVERVGPELLHPHRQRRLEVPQGDLRVPNVHRDDAEVVRRLGHIPVQDTPILPPPHQLAQLVQLVVRHERLVAELQRLLVLAPLVPLRAQRHLGVCRLFLPYAEPHTHHQNRQEHLRGLDGQTR